MSKIVKINFIKNQNSNIYLYVKIIGNYNFINIFQCRYTNSQAHLLTLLVNSFIINYKI